MSQLTFEAVCAEFAGRKAILEKSVEEELVLQMAEAISEVFKGERREENEDEGSFEQ